MDDVDLEGEADLFLRDACVDPLDRIGGISVVERLPTVHAVEYVRCRRPPYAWRELLSTGLDRVLLHNGPEVSQLALNWRSVAEGVEGRFARRSLPLIDPRIKRAVGGVVARVLVPRLALRRAFSAVGLDLPVLAVTFGVSQLTLALRLGEVRGMPVAIVGAHAIKRGPVPGTPGDAELFRIARRGGTREWMAVPITDEPAMLWMVWPRDY